MNKKISNLLILLLILFSINIGNVKAAVVSGGGTGSSFTSKSSKSAISTDKCFYGMKCEYGSAITTNDNGHGMIFVTIAFQCYDTSRIFKACDSFVSYADAETSTGGSSREVYIENYDTIFHQTDLYKSKFSDGARIPGYKCPNLYMIEQLGNDKISLYYEDRDQFQFMTLTESSCINENETADVKTDTAKSASNEKVSGLSEEGKLSNNSDLMQSVLNWANWYKSSGSSSNTNDSDSPSCSTLLGGDQGEIVQFIQRVYRLMAAGAIIMLIFLVSIDFVKAIAASDEDGLKKAFEKSKKRLIGLIILFLLPALLDMIINFINNNTHYDGQEWVIGSVSDCQVTK